jgi:hypothetical protein
VGHLFKAEPYVRIVGRSPVLLRAPRAALRRMALTLLLGLAIFWVPVLIAREYGMSLLIAGFPLFLLLTTFRGANTLRLDPKRERLILRRHFLFHTRTLGDAPFSDVEEISVDRRFAPAWQESRLAPLSVLFATFGVHAHFGGNEVVVPVWDLVIRLRTTEVLVVITAEDPETLEAACRILKERLKLPAS